MLLLELCCAAAIAAVNVLLSFSMGDMTNAAVGADLPALGMASALCVGCLAALYGLQALEMKARKTLTGRCICTLKGELYAGLANRGIGEFHRREDSWYLNLLQGDIDTLERDYFDAFWRAVSLGIKVVCCVIALVAVSWRLFLIFAALSVFPQVLSRLVKRPLQRSKDRFSWQNSRCIQRQREFIQGFDTLLCFSKAESFTRRLEQEDEALERSRTWRDLCGVLTTGGASTVNMIAQILCMAAAAFYIARGELAIGALTTSTQLLNYIFSPLNTVLTCVLTMGSTRGIREKFSQFRQKPSGGQACPGGDIVFDHVTLGYGERTVVRELCCSFEPGKKYAIVGPSGAGKSTLAKAMLGTLTPAGGRITVGGTSIETLDAKSLHRKVLYVPQTPFLFQGTVEENIRFFEPSGQAAQAARRAALPEELLSAQAGGDQGQTLSGGEKSRISIARALCSDAEILIFDEPASGLDPETAREIEHLILGLSGKTVLVITHNWDEGYLARFDGVLRVGGGV